MFYHWIFGDGEPEAALEPKAAAAGTLIQTTSGRKSPCSLHNIDDNSGGDDGCGGDGDDDGGCDDGSVGNGCGSKGGDGGDKCRLG